MNGSDIESRLLIRELYGRYAIAAAEQDGATWLACWTENATWKTPHFEVSGHQALRESWTATWTNFTNVAAFNEVGTVSLEGDKAKATSSVLEIMRLSGGGVMKMAGLYYDELAREDGSWRFARREYRLIHQEVSGGT